MIHFSLVGIRQKLEHFYKCFPLGRKLFYTVRSFKLTLLEVSKKSEILLKVSHFYLGLFPMLTIVRL